MARILVVDDDPSVRALLRDVLESEGHAVVLAPDGFAALRAVAAQLPDAVVLDVRMPGMDGHEVLARLRARSDGRELPVVMVTGIADDGHAWRAWNGGVELFLGKPFEPEQLVRHLSGLGSRRSLSGR